MELVIYLSDKKREKNKEKKIVERKWKWLPKSLTCKFLIHLLAKSEWS